MAGIHLIVQYCNDSRPGRQAEYDECLRRNLACPAIAAVHNLVEPDTSVPEEFREHPKMREHGLDRWLTYQDAFAYANERLQGETVAITNLDIFLDPSSGWNDLGFLANGVVLCLSRFEWDTDGRVFRDPGFERLGFANTQDAWVFQAPFEVPDCDFEIGTLGCDNAIAERIKRAGRIPVNAASRYRIFHFDRCRGKTSANQQEVHRNDRADRPRRRPEEEGQYLLPDMDQVRSIDQLLTALNATELQRYMVACDVMSRFVRIKNAD
jgi:hypothetical protein